MLCNGGAQARSRLRGRQDVRSVGQPGNPLRHAQIGQRGQFARAWNRLNAHTRNRLICNGCAVGGPFAAAIQSFAEQRVLRVTGEMFRDGSIFELHNPRDVGLAD